MTDKILDNNKEEQTAAEKHRSPALAWIALALTLLAWAMLMWVNGYVAMGVAAVALVAGFAGIPGRSAAIRNLAITSVIAAMVLLIVLAAFIIVIKVGLSV